MKRRAFIAGLGVTAAAWPLAARAQQGDRVRRIGWLRPGLADDNDPLLKSLVSAFTRALADLGWTVGRNVRIDLRWGGGDNFVTPQNPVIAAYKNFSGLPAGGHSLLAKCPRLGRAELSLAQVKRSQAKLSRASEPVTALADSSFSDPCPPSHPAPSHPGTAGQALLLPQAGNWGLTAGPVLPG
jgi:hypothetical protein